MNDFLLALGLADAKPLLTPLLLPPVPLLCLVLAGAWQMRRRPALGWLLLWLAVAGIWLSSTTGFSRVLIRELLQAPPALTERERLELKGLPRTAIVVLGGGRRETAPEYGTAQLLPRSISRLRYGLWLSRQTGLPVAFSGGIGRGGRQGPTEAELAARMAEQDYKQKLRWVEDRSQDTRENAMQTVALLRQAGIERIVLVTHATHMPRALRNFQRAAQGSALQLQAAPEGGPSPYSAGLADWLPSTRGLEENWLAWHEAWGLLLGA